MEIKPNKQGNKDWHRLDFSVPITCAATDKDFIISGTAINSTLTRNGVEFTSQELKKSAKSLQNRPLLKDHENSVDAIVGRITRATFDDGTEAVKFTARVQDRKMQEMIHDGRITSVSVGAMVQNLDMIEDGDSSFLRARGIDFVELSLVAVPADPNAGLENQGIAHAIKACYELKQSYNTPKEEIKVSEKTENKESILIQENADLKAKLDKIEEEKRIELEVETRLTAKLEEIKASADDDKESEEETKVEEKTKTKVDETVGIVGSSADDDDDKVEEKLNNFDITKSDVGAGYSMSMSSYSDGTYSRLTPRSSSVYSGGKE